MSKYSKEAMRARFWELTAEMEALHAKSAPTRKLRDELKDNLRDPLAAFKASKLAVVKIERPRMAEIDTEMAMLARALTQKVGPRPN